jgi:RimJ/RimL family protein N-acetyltransferase
MTVELRTRTEEHVRIQYEKIRDPEIWAMIPMTDKTLEQAIEDYQKTQQPDASSYGRTIYVDDAYAGDVWCYCIDLEEEPNAMVGYCLLEKKLWGKGITTEAVKRFLEEVTLRFGLKTVGGIAYCDNAASLRVMEKNGFRKMEEFTEDGVLSAYYQKELGL